MPVRAEIQANDLTAFWQTEKMRDSRIDVARGLLIIGVVVGHLWERSGGWDGGVQRVALTALYAFHMPAFVFLTGMLANSRRSVEKIAGLLSVLCCFQLLYIAFLAVTGRPLEQWYWPYWVLWFILAMVWWQLLTPVIERWPRAVFVASIAAALVIGAVHLHGNWFTYQRAIVFLPFFVGGMIWGKRILEYVRARTALIRTVPVVLFLGGVIALVAWDPDPHWLFMNWTYGQLGVAVIPGILLRIAVLFVGAVGTLGFLAVLPQRSAPLSWLGKRTLPVFLFHVFGVLLYGWYLVPVLADLPGSVWLVVGLCGGGILAYLSATPPFSWLATAVRMAPARPSSRNGRATAPRGTKSPEGP